MFPSIITSLVEAQVSFKRLQTFLLNEELDPRSVIRVTQSPYAVQIRDGTFKWDVIKKQEEKKDENKDKKDKKKGKKQEEEKEVKHGPVELEEEVITLQDINFTVNKKKKGRQFFSKILIQKKKNKTRWLLVNLW